VVSIWNDFTGIISDLYWWRALGSQCDVVAATASICANSSGLEAKAPSSVQCSVCLHVIALRKYWHRSGLHGCSCSASYAASAVGGWTSQHIIKVYCYEQDENILFTYTLACIVPLYGFTGTCIAEISTALQDATPKKSVVFICCFLPSIVL
jgi:hypothetical protein